MFVRNTTKYQDMSDISFNTAQNVGIHSIPNDSNIIRMEPKLLNGLSYHQWIWFPGVVGLPASGHFNYRGPSATCRLDVPILHRISNVGICSDQSCSVMDQTCCFTNFCMNEIAGFTNDYVIR